MNIEEAIKYIKNDIEIDKDTASWFENGNMTKEQIEESIDAYETLLTAYEKEKEKNKELESYCNDVRKEMNEENRRCMLLAVENQDLKGNKIKEWNSAVEASKKTKICAGSICKCRSGSYKTAGGYIWKYKD